MVSGLNPFNIYIHEEGLTRFATIPYVKPTGKNLKYPCMHLTNYAVNKDSTSFIHNDTVDADDVGHKRSLTSVFGELEAKGVDVDHLWGEMQAIIIKTLLVAQP